MEVKTNSYFRDSWITGKESKNCLTVRETSSLCAWLISASWCTLSVKSHFGAAKGGHCPSTLFSQRFPHWKTYFLLCWELRKPGFYQIWMLHSPHISQTSIKYSGYEIPFALPVHSWIIFEQGESKKVLQLLPPSFQFLNLPFFKALWTIQHKVLL